ncbi:hypothetical protein ACHHYP_11569 [Achlya hypogyna]|uniref:START domain-containing protein n=1 Tax=Achlya hypogyna TaxID=1202772 RepID=A0A1V9ZHH6_ACHHY|nr:hypothetical protein ACHHYP_11569 [Achlya hypogyna]
MPKLPLPANYFESCSALTAKDEARLIQTGLQSLTDVVRAASLEGGPIQWTLDVDGDGVQIYAGVDPVAPPGVDTCYCGTIELHATLDEAAALFDVNSTAAMRAYIARFAKDFADCASLYTLAPRTDEHPHNYIGVKWLAVTLPTPLVKDRDWCYLEVQDDFRINGVKGWARSFSSVTLPGCPPIEGLVRATFHRAGYVFVESRPGHLRCTHVVQADLGGALPLWIVRAGMRRRMVHLLELDQYLREQRLRVAPMLSDEQLVALAARRTCFLCIEKFSLFVPKRQCRSCGEIVCKLCSKLWAIGGAWQRRQRPSLELFHHEKAPATMGGSSGQGSCCREHIHHASAQPLDRRSVSCRGQTLHRKNGRGVPAAAAFSQRPGEHKRWVDRGRHTDAFPQSRPVVPRAAFPDAIDVTQLDASPAQLRQLLQHLRAMGAQTKRHFPIVMQLVSIALVCLAASAEASKSPTNPIWKEVLALPDITSISTLLTTDGTYLEVRYNGAKQETHTIPKVSRLCLTGVTLPEGLQSLTLSGVNLKTIPKDFKWPESLTAIDLSGNQLTTYPATITLPKGLSSLNLKGNKIESFSDYMTWPTNLTDLNIASNKLSRVIALPASLTKLDLSSNPLKKFDAGQQWPSALGELNAANTQISALPGNLPSSLRILRLASNHITKFPCRSDVPDSIHYLGLTHNKIASIPSNLEWPEIFTVELDNNCITELPKAWRVPPSLGILSLDENKLTSLPDSCDWMSRITQLTLRDNALAKFPAKCTLPGDLALQNNNITALEDMALPAHLDLSNNPIEKINRVTFPAGIYWTTSNFTLKEFSLSSEMFDILATATDHTYFMPRFTTDDESVQATCGYGSVKKLHDFPITVCVV